MRSYKGGRGSNPGSVIMGPDGEVLPIGGGVASLADANSSVADATDHLQGMYGPLGGPSYGQKP